MVILIFNMYSIIKSKYADVKYGYNYTITNILKYTNSFEFHEKVNFYDETVFDIDKIEYKDSFIQNNKKVIKISKGCMDKKIVKDIEEFNKFKNLL